MSRTTTPRSRLVPERRAPRRAPAKPVACGIAGGIAHIRLERPRSGNRLNLAMIETLREAAENVASDASVRVVLLTAVGPDFCAGGLELRMGGSGQAAAQSRTAAADPEELRVASAVAAISQPVIAALHGRVFDQGLELALAADIRVAAVGTRLAIRQVVNGGFPFDGGTQRLPRIAGRGLAAEMLLLGRVIEADVALRAGLVTEVVPVGRLRARAAGIARDIAESGAAATRFAKEAIRAGSELPIDSGMRLEADLSILLHHDPERMERLKPWRRPFSPAGRGTTSDDR
ncbi:MAG: enoyl-CoA hydratase/isomerase family protein [Chloroflexi bacterium]|nr:enoyl-CoA hydratase/isomerase family protein [Chloroflexota bacterium]